MKISGIIFDLDGVIVSTDKFHYLAWKKAADREGIYFDEVINNRLRGVSRMASLDIILERADRKYSVQEKEALAEYKNNIYKELLNGLSPADRLPHVSETLDALRARGIKLAIGSSSKNTAAILEKIGYSDYFDAVSDGNNITHSKPDPEVFVKAAALLGLNPSECMIVEDAVAGIEAGKAGNFTTAGLGEAAAYQKTDIRLGTIADLLAVVE